MDPTDKVLEGMFQECPQLKDESFLKSFPGVCDVASFFYSTTEHVALPPALKEMGINSVGEYICKMDEGDVKAIELYKKVKDICNF